MQHFTIAQKQLLAKFANSFETSGLSTEEIAEVMSESIGSLLAYTAPSKEELAEYLDNTVFPLTRSTALDWYDLRHKDDN